jgi:hypothetical protein
VWSFLPEGHSTERLPAKMISADVEPRRAPLQHAAINGRCQTIKRKYLGERFFDPQINAASARREERVMTTIDILKASAMDLQRRAEEHRRMIAVAIEKNDVKGVFDACHLLDCSHKQDLKQILLEAISVLEDTRRAFKSRQLEALRRKMIRILAEQA